MSGPTEKEKRAYDRGVHDRRRGCEKADNPFKRHHVTDLSRWWVAGYVTASTKGRADK